MTRRYSYDPITTGSFGRWPGDRGLAVYVAIGVEDYRRGEGQSEDLLYTQDGNTYRIVVAQIKHFTK